MQELSSPPHCLLILPGLHQLPYQDLMGNMKNLSEDKTDSIPCSPLIYQGSLFIGGGYQVVKSQQTLGESMLITPDHFVILYVLGNAFQVYLLHHLPTI